MQLKGLIIGTYKPKYPIIQGGMSIRVSTASLAAAVARAGGVGVIGGTGISPQELAEEIKAAQANAEGGILGVNIMFAASLFKELVQTAIDHGIDIIFTGAGFSRDIFKMVEGSSVAVVPIVSSARAARLAEQCGAVAVVAEGMEAGGHLGTDRSIKEILPEIKAKVKIPVIAAGGIVDGYDMAEMIKLGADGIQMATRFLLSEECSVDAAYKAVYLQARAEDVILIKSPVGLPGRAIRNAFTDMLAVNECLEVEECDGCLKDCSQVYCINRALVAARNGDIDQGVVFTGQNVYKIKEILTVEEIIQNTIKQYSSVPD